MGARCKRDRAPALRDCASQSELMTTRRAIHYCVRFRGFLYSRKLILTDASVVRCRVCVHKHSGIAWVHPAVSSTTTSHASRCSPFAQRICPPPDAPSPAAPLRIVSPCPSHFARRPRHVSPRGAWWRSGTCVLPIAQPLPCRNFSAPRSAAPLDVMPSP